MSWLNRVQFKPFSEILFAMNEEYSKDRFPGKLDLISGVYRDDDGKFWVLPVVRRVEQRFAADLQHDKAYIHALGVEDFCTASARFLLGPDSSSIKENRVTAVQTLGGGGALRVGAELLFRVGQFKTVYASAPAYGNYKTVFLDAGFETYRTYHYWDSHNKCLDFNGMISDLLEAPENSVVILQACGHNPTGIDPTREQWKHIAEVMEKRKLFPFFDVAYQGLASGDVDDDVWPVRYFDSRGFEMICAQSFSKICSLYSERVGNMILVAPDASAIEPIRSHVLDIVISHYSHPPGHGARIIAEIMKEPSLYEEWKRCIQTMYNRIVSMRKALRNRLEELGTPGTWDHITNQTGMFCFTGLSAGALKKLVKEYHVYLTINEGRINMAGLNPGNINHVAQCIHRAVIDN